MPAKLLSERGLTFERLDKLCEAAEHLSLARAAKARNTSPESFSRDIQQLEEFFGVELIRQTGRGIELTEFGEQLQAVAREQLQTLSDFKSACMRRAVNLAIGAGDSQLQWLILERLPQIIQRMPNVTFRLSESFYTSRLRAGTVDLLFTRQGVVKPPLKTRPLGVMSYSLFIPEKFAPHSASGGFQPELLSRIPIGILDGEGQFQDELQRILKRLNITLDCKIQSFSFPLLARAVKQGVIGAILPNLACRDFEGTNVKIFSPKFLDSLKRPTVLAWNPRVARVRPVVEKAVQIFSECCKF
jgi:DNA-binding transcriptional LysR family regulator